MTMPDGDAMARSALYELLSVAFLYPEPGRGALLAEGAVQVGQAVAALGWETRARLMEDLARRLDPLPADDALAAEYITLFGHTVSPNCPPYEGEYGQDNIFQKAQTLTDLQTFYRAFGVGVNPALKDRIDHLSVELEFLHLLTVKEAYALRFRHEEEKVRLCRDAQEAFLARHLAPWVQGFARRVLQRTEKGGVYTLLAQLLSAHLSAEFEAFGLQGALAESAAPPELGEDLECAESPFVQDMAGLQLAERMES